MLERIIYYFMARKSCKLPRVCGFSILTGNSSLASERESARGENYCVLKYAN